MNGLVNDTHAALADQLAQFVIREAASFVAGSEIRLRRRLTRRLDTETQQAGRTNPMPRPRRNLRTALSTVSGFGHAIGSGVVERVRVRAGRVPK